MQDLTTVFTRAKVQAEGPRKGEAMAAGSKVTLEHIAAHFGVSKTTVSRALSGKGRVSAARREEIRRYAEEAGYPVESGPPVPENICVVLPDNLLDDSIFFQTCLAGILDALQKYRCNTMIVLERGNRTDRLSEALTRMRCDGVILLQNYIDDQQMRYLRNIGMPFVLGGTSSDPDVYQVDGNVYQAADVMTTHLIERGSKRIAFVGGMEHYSVNRDRCAGYLRALQDHLMPQRNDLVFRNITTAEDAGNAADLMLSRGADAVIASDDILSSLLLQALTERGVYVPAEFRIGSLYDSTYTQTAYPPITSMSIPTRKIGAALSEKLAALVRGENPERITNIDYRLLERRSSD